MCGGRGSAAAPLLPMVWSGCVPGSTAKQSVKNQHKPMKNQWFSAGMGGTE